MYGTKEQLDAYQNKKPDGTKKLPTKQDTAIIKAFLDKYKKEDIILRKPLVNSRDWMS